MLDAKLFDVNVDSFLKGAKFGYNKEDNSVKIEYTDQRTQINYSPTFNITIQAPQAQSATSHLSKENVEKICTDTLRLTLEKVLKEQEPQIAQYFARYSSTALMIGASGVVISNIGESLAAGTAAPLPAGDFFSDFPQAILAGTDPSVITFVGGKSKE